MPDLRVEPERRLDRIAFNQYVEQVARAAGHELPQVALRGAGEPGELSPNLSACSQSRQPPPRLAAFEDEIAQRIGRGFDRAVVVGQALSVARENRASSLCVSRASSQPERTAVGQRQEIRERAFDDPRAVIRELELADDFGIRRLTV